VGFEATEWSDGHYRKEEQQDWFVEVFAANQKIKDFELPDYFVEKFLSFNTCQQKSHYERTQKVGIVLQLTILDDGDFDFYRSNPDEIG
jgi:hypothetical protein